MAYNDWRDLDFQNAYAPYPGKIEQFKNLYQTYKYYLNRPYYTYYSNRLKEIDTATFVVEWLKDVLKNIEYPYTTVNSLYKSLTKISTPVMTGEADTTYNFYAGDIVFLSKTNDFITPSNGSFYVGIWFGDDYLSFNGEGLYTQSLSEFLTTYPQYLYMSVFRI